MNGEQPNMAMSLMANPSVNSRPPNDEECLWSLWEVDEFVTQFGHPKSVMLSQATMAATGERDKTLSLRWQKYNSIITNWIFSSYNEMESNSVLKEPMVALLIYKE
jgi:hypothetical protein